MQKSSEKLRSAEFLQFKHLETVKMIITAKRLSGYPQIPAKASKQVDTMHPCK